MKMLLIGLLAFSLLAAGCLDSLQSASQTPSEQNDSMMEKNGSMEKDGAMIKNESAMEEDEQMMEKDESAMMSEDYSGEILAGSSAPLLDFNKADYDKAVASDNLVVLYFYASWCPICQAEFPKMKEAFDQLSGKNVVGFRVNYNDDQTDEFETELAREFGIAYQHTKVFVKNGERVLKAPDTWETQRYLEEISKAA